MIMRNLKICHINPRRICASRCHYKLDELAVVACVHDFNIYCVSQKIGWYLMSLIRAFYCMAIQNISVFTETPTVMA